MSQINAESLGNTTMYNLQTKRTLPRDVIKWMQGLDLSYSVKDYRKDLSNGFLIAQIVSRYEPGKIPMHAFQNSHNQSRKDNNWNLLTTYFNKQQLRKIKIQQNEYSRIKSGNDPKSEQLYQFICRLYSICTKRNLPEPTSPHQLPPTQAKNPNLTASYLLKEDGLQKLQNSNVSHNSNQDGEKSFEDRVPTRKMAPNFDTRIDNKGLRQQINRKMTSKKKSWEAKSQSFYEESNPYVEKYVFDFLNQILQECFHQQQNLDHTIKEALQKKQLKPIQIIIKVLPIDTLVVANFVGAVKSSINDILTVMLKDLNQIWSFFIYFIRMLAFFSYESQQFAQVIDLLVTYATSANLNEKKKLNKVFLQSLIDAIIGEVKASAEWHKKQRIMEIIYDFSGRQLEDKKAVLFNLKEKLGSNNPLYFSWLAVLVREENFTNGNPKLVEDFIYYAHQNYSSSNTQLRTASLKILSEVARNGWVSSIQKFFSQQINIRRARYINDFESIYFVSIIYFCLLKNIIESNDYQTLVKGKNQGNTNTIKVYNPDHERQTSEIKHKVQNISMTLAYLYHNSTSAIVRQVMAKQAINFITQSSPLILLVVYHLGLLQNLNEFFTEQKMECELRTTRVIENPANMAMVKENVNDLIAELLRQHQDKRSANIPENADLNIEVKQQLPFIDFCLEHINIKKFNIELWEEVGQKLIRPVIHALSDPNHADAAWRIIKKIYLIIFNYDMKMHNIDLWMAECLAEILSHSPSGNAVTNQIKQFFKEEYKNSNLEQIKNCANQLNEALVQKGLQNLVEFDRK